MKAIGLHTKNQAIHFSRWTNTSYAVFRSIGKQVVIGVITGLLERLNSVKSTVIHFIDGREADLHAPGNEPDGWDEMVDKDGLQTNLLFCIPVQPGNSELSHPGFDKSFTYPKYLYVALIGPFLLPCNLKGSAGFLSFNYFKKFHHE